MFPSFLVADALRASMGWRLIFLLAAFSSVYGAPEPPNLTFLSKNGTDTEDYFCIVDGKTLSSAVGWIYPVEEAAKDQMPRIVTNYVPKLGNKYDCSFAKGKQCNSRWQEAMDDWRPSDLEPRNLEPTLSVPWEDFPTLWTSDGEDGFSNRIEVPHVFRLGLSVRTAGNAEMFLCEGWSPEHYPCYYINVGGADNRRAFLLKVKSVAREVVEEMEMKLSKYNGDVALLSKNEWKNFALTLDRDGTISLSDMYKNLTLLNYNDKKALQPIYLFVKSRNGTALWKIHNNRYMFTNKSKLTQLGPSLAMPGKDLCVSLSVSMCKLCKMSFYVLADGKKQIIKTLFNEHERDEFTWKEVKLTQHDILEDQVEMYVETKYVVSNTAARGGLWAIDEARVCSENEVRVTQLTKVKGTNGTKPDVSCQVLSLPTWRPPLHDFIDDRTDEIQLTSSTTSIKLRPNSSTEREYDYQRYYAVEYKGEDFCKGEDVSQNKERRKSHGHAVGRTDEIVLANLVPYTVYTVTFSDVGRTVERHRRISTLPTDVPTKEELPRNLTVKPTDTTIEVYWKVPRCNETYGPLVYRLSIKISGASDLETTTVKDVKTRYKFMDLVPFTNYTLEIVTARKVADLNGTDLSLKVVHNFTTLAGVAPVVRNLEVYSMDKAGARLRFDLPKSPHGSPESVQVRWCHPLLFEGCRSDMRNLTRCGLWPDKYCTDVDGLMVAYDYAFLVSVKNRGTHAFGDEARVTGTTLNRVPGKPSNLTYEMTDCDKSLDYCNIKVSWAHPYHQNGTITMFDVIVNETSYTATTDTLKSIHEVLKVAHEYRPAYSYVVRYIPYNTPYKIAVRAVNDEFKGAFTEIRIKTDDIGRYIDQTPEFVACTNETVTFRLPQLDWRLNSSTLILIVQDYNPDEKEIDEDVAKLETFEGENQLCNRFGETWVAKSVQLSVAPASPVAVVVGDGTESYSPHLGKTVFNKPLRPDTEYCFTFTLLNAYRNSVNVAVHHVKHVFTEAGSPVAAPPQERRQSSVAVYVVPTLFLLLLITCGVWLLSRYLRRRGPRAGDGEHVYESMPFDDYVVGAVSNDTYDKLVHS